MAYGTWNRATQMKGLIPSPTCGIRKLLSQHFTVIDTPEYNTTKLCCKCQIGHMKPVMKRKIRKKVWNGEEKEWIEKEIDVHGLRRCNKESNYSVFPFNNNRMCNFNEQRL